MPAGARTVAVGLGHQGHVELVLSRDLLHHQAPERLTVSHAHDICVGEVELKLRIRVFVVEGVDIPAQLVHVADDFVQKRHGGQQINDVVGGALQHIARIRGCDGALATTDEEELGLYWVTSQHPEKPWVIEVRRGEAGARAWQARPGEYHHSTSGERGGLWRNRGRATQKIWGTGFSAHGFDSSAPFVQMPDARSSAASWIMDGIDPDEPIGDFGLLGGGAAGYELDRYDRALGTPPHALLLASSIDHTPNYMLAAEDIFFAHPGMGGGEHPWVRGDIVYFTTPNGGAMFATSSIAWCGSLSHTNYRNNVSRVTDNVLSRFARDEPLPALPED